MTRRPISVTVVTGFLGSGKTSLLNTIIEQNPNKKFTIIENEFGAVNIDRELIKKVDGTKIYELTNGCACCTMNQELGTTLNSLIMSGLEYDNLIIEASGVADPASLISTFLSGDRVRRFFKLDAVICIVDAGNVMKQLESFEETEKQIAIAQKVIVNKTDTISEDQRQEIEQRLHAINPTADFNFAEFAKVQTLNFLDCNAYGVETVESTLFKDITLRSVGHNPGSQHKINSFAYVATGLFKMESFSFWLDSYLFYNKHNILRIKGILAFNDLSRRIVLQAVQDSVVIDQSEPWGDKDPFVKIVFIGKQLNEEELTEGLNKLIIKN